MKESDFDSLEIMALKTLVQPLMDNKISSKHTRFWKVVYHKLELQAKIHSKEIEKEIAQSSLTQKSGSGE